MNLTAAGDSEQFKGSVHLALGALAVTCLAYNLACLQRRPCWRLAANCVIYGAVSWFEASQVLRHLKP